MALSTIFTYIKYSNTGAVIFTWFSSITATLTNWEMRKAFKLQSDSPLTLQYAYKNKFYPLGSVFLCSSSIFVLASVFYVSIFPIDTQTSVATFFDTFFSCILSIRLFTKRRQLILLRRIVKLGEGH
jgi:amino acid transporter